MVCCEIVTILLAQNLLTEHSAAGIFQNNVINIQIIVFKI